MPPTLPYSDGENPRLTAQGSRGGRTGIEQIADTQTMRASGAGAIVAPVIEHKTVLPPVNLSISRAAIRHCHSNEWISWGVLSTLPGSERNDAAWRRRPRARQGETEQCIIGVSRRNHREGKDYGNNLPEQKHNKNISLVVELKTRMIAG